MKKFAVIDIGSNSVRLMLVADGKVLYKRLQTTRLGEGLASSSFLMEQAIERTAIAVADFYYSAIDERAESVFAFATAAVRSAQNRDVFLERVKTLCGLDVEVISGEEEAEIGIGGALGGADGGVIDIGGASTEVVVKENGALIYKKSVNIGVVRLKDACGRNKEKLYERAYLETERFGQVPNAEMYAIGGTATTIAAWVLNLREYDSEKVTGAVVSLEQIQALVDEICALTVEEIAAKPCVSAGRADVLAGGVILLHVLMQMLGLKRIIVSDRDNLEGYAIRKGLL